MIDFLTALESLRPKAQWSIHGKSYADVVWLDEDTVPPTEEEIQAEIVRLQNKELTDKEEAQAKLAKLGLTTDDLKALLG